MHIDSYRKLGINTHWFIYAHRHRDDVGDINNNNNNNNRNNNIFSIVDMFYGSEDTHLLIFQFRPYSNLFIGIILYVMWGRICYIMLHVIIIYIYTMPIYIEWHMDIAWKSSLHAWLGNKPVLAPVDGWFTAYIDWL